MAVRRGRSLLAWVNGPDLRPIFIASGVTNPADYDQFKVMWRAAQMRSVALPAIGPFNRATVEPLPASLAPRVDALTHSELFGTFYDHFTPPVTVASIPLADLVAPQWWIDADHVSELSGRVPAQGDAEGLFDFCFPIGNLERPAIIGIQGNVVEFIGHGRAIGGPTAIRIEDYQRDKVRLAFDVISRPNFIYVALLAAPSIAPRLLLINGVHHASALVRSGHARTYCILKEVSDFGELELLFNDPGMFKPGRLGAPRPPRLVDYFSPTVADDVDTYAVDQRMRLILSSELSAIPVIDR